MGKPNLNIAVTLVHGTWGRGFIPSLTRSRKPRWFERESSFATKLATHLGEVGCSNLTFRKIEWCGANSFFARDRAARVLAAEIDAARNEEPELCQLIIGHSHGGNVALRAVEYLEHVDRLAIASLATPFVELLPQTPPRKEMPEAAFAAAIFLASTYLLLRSILGDPREPTEFNGTDIIFAFLLGLPAYLFVTQFRKRLAHRLQTFSSQQAYREAGIPTLVLRGVDDEAALALATGSIATRLGRLFSAIGERLHIASFVLVILFLTVFFSFNYLSGFVSATAFVEASLPYMAYFNMLSPGLLLVIGGSAYLAGAMPGVFGRELFLTYIDVQISSNSSPDSTTITTVTLPSTEGQDKGFIHSLYSYPKSAEEISSWYAKLSYSDTFSATRA